MPNIRPISDLRNNANEISEICHQTREPVFITKNASPHNSGQTLSKIIDNEGQIYFEAQPGELILDRLAVSDDEQTLVFYTDDIKRESRKLVVAQIDRNKKFQKKTAIDAQFGDVEIIDNQTIIVTPPGGAVHYYEQPSSNINISI